MKARWREVVTLFFLTGGLILIGLAAAWIRFLHTPLITDEHGFKYTVHPGVSTRAVINDLYLQNIIKYPVFFKVLLRLKKFKGSPTQLKAGEYVFPKGSTPLDVLNQMILGSGILYHSFTIVEGWNFRQLEEALAEENHLHHTLQSLTNATLMAELKHPELEPEGQFFPDTYYFVEGTSDVALLKRAFRRLQQKLELAWLNRAPDLPYKTPYEALTAASLIEKEAYYPTELPIISGVLVNRLKKQMLLQFDPTVIYGMGIKYSGKIHKGDLHRNNSYNTYVKKGLPPTPICMPALEAIQAALHPEQHDYLYFVAKGDGSHQFSRTLVEHYKAVAMAKKFKPGFYNLPLVRYYLLQTISMRLSS